MRLVGSRITPNRGDSDPFYRGVLRDLRPRIWGIRVRDTPKRVFSDPFHRGVLRDLGTQNTPKRGQKHPFLALCIKGF